MGSGLEYSATSSPPLPSELDTSPSDLAHHNFQWTSPPLNPAFTMYTQPAYPSYAGQDIPIIEDLGQNYQLDAPPLPDTSYQLSYQQHFEHQQTAFPDCGHDHTLASTGDGFTSFPGTFNFVPVQQLSTAMSNMNRNVDEAEWTDVNLDYSGEGESQPSSEDSSSESVSPEATSANAESLGDEHWNWVPSYRDDILELRDSVNPMSMPCTGPRSVKNGGPLNQKGNRGGNRGGRIAPLNPEQREHASNTRQKVACIRCQYQKVKCKANPDPNDDRCLTCLAVDLGSKKTIHRLVCKRWKLSSTVLYRSGGLEFTKRRGWEGTQVADLEPHNWTSDQPRTIKLTLGLIDEPFEFRVRKFKPEPGDVLNRTWSYNGMTYETRIAPYAMENTDRARRVLFNHITANANAAIENYARDPQLHDLVGQTYKAAWDHMIHVNNNKMRPNSTGVDPKRFMQDLLALWFATKNSLRSAWLVGDERLDMDFETRQGYPFPNRLSVPRMICQQFDALNVNLIMQPARGRVLTDLWKLISSTDPQWFFTIYLAVFILLHQASAISKDRYWHARHRSYVRRYDKERDMEDIQEGANIVLLCWHYYNRCLSPLTVPWEKIRKAEPGKKTRERIYSDIRPDQERLMRELAEISALESVPETDAERYGWDGLIIDHKYPLIWERDLHFVSQMFKKDWAPEDTWRRSMDD
ncbi:hypothetical protein JX265_013495 [Neoarthrinium moseri]|uniref:Zn(2)-C6 fungal-type domain-containing protein n=1 Tax=Neoarthrinium moseri TaxID=1658444 RepID=A0A9P9W8C7_9PEZI|nr:hypothetical protein JX265_013495 [Neoarthrinium moseri]